jgi:hypothetical protein
MAVGTAGHRLREVDPVALPVNVPHDLFVQLDERTVAGTVHDRQMKLIVESIVPRCVKGVGRSAHLAMNTVDLIQDFLFRSFRDTRCCKLFQADQDLHPLSNLNSIGIRHNGTHVGNESYQSFGFEHFQRLPQRGARDPKFLAQERLGKPLSRFPTILDDVAADMRKYLVVNWLVAHDLARASSWRCS